MTRLLVLGLLNMQPLSGYDIQHILKTNDSERWAGVLIGSIYHALKKLEIEKFIEVTSVEQTGNRQKTVYKITTAGIKHLKDLTRDCLQEASVHYPSTLYSGLSFIENIKYSEVFESLEKQQKLLDIELLSVQQGLEEKALAMENNIPPLTNLIFENMFEIIKLQQNFVKKALKLIGKDK